MNRKAWFADILKKYDRIAVCGLVNAGKSTLVRAVRDRPRLHTDDFRYQAWADVPHAAIEAVKNAVGDDKRFVIEGMTVPRALRKGMEVDVVLWLGQELEENSKGQKSFGKAARTVLDEWHETHQGVPILEAPRVATDDDDE